MAVYKSNIEISEWSRSLFDSCTLAREATSDSFSYGDFCDGSAAVTYDGTVDIMATGSGSNNAFIGVSRSTIDGSVDTTSKVNIAMKCVIRCKTAATIYFGEGCYASAGANGTTWTLKDDSGANGIAWCRSDVIASGATGLFLVDPFTIRAVTQFGFFELSTGA